MSQTILFDGNCALCNSATRFIIRHDPHKKFIFIPLHSDKGKQLLTDTEKQKYADSLILLKSGRAFFKSKAVFQIAGELDGSWRFLSVLRFIPSGFSDRIYDLIARNRHRLTDNRGECDIPDMTGNRRFLA